MKHYLFFIGILFMTNTLNAQNMKEIKLNAPNKTRGASLMQALNDRESVREFSNKPLSTQDLSDLLWAANGINRPDSKKRTAPSALNKQDVDIYVCLPEGIYLYDAEKNSLKPVAEGDHRAAVGGQQDFVRKAPVSLILVSDISRFGMGDNEQVRLMAAMDAGIVSQNINLFCAANNLVTVPRASMDKDKLKKVLNLKEHQLLLMNNPVGYPQKK